jgi:hypothetical protein
MRYLIKFIDFIHNKNDLERKLTNIIKSLNKSVWMTKQSDRYESISIYLQTLIPYKYLFYVNI